MALEQVVDGDTIVVTGGERVRLIGIDTPETKDPRTGVQCFGREASAHLEELLPPGTELRLVPDVEATDRYGRTLAYVYRADDGLFVNAEIVSAGFAVTATYPPNVAHAEELAALARDAREAAAGSGRRAMPTRHRRQRPRSPRSRSRGAAATPPIPTAASRRRLPTSTAATSASAGSASYHRTRTASTPTATGSAASPDASRPRRTSSSRWAVRRPRNGPSP